MKRLVIKILVFLTLMALLAGCGDDNDVNQDGDSDATVDGDNELSDLTWHDSVSGLTWQNPDDDDSLYLMDITSKDAVTYCENLSFDGKNDWRLPTISELRSLIRACESIMTGGSCELSDNCLSLSCLDETKCKTCINDEGSGKNGCYMPSEINGRCSRYWSASAVGDIQDSAWGISFVNGDIQEEGTGSDVGNVTMSVRCVR